MGWVIVPRFNGASERAGVPLFPPRPSTATDADVVACGPACHLNVGSCDSYIGEPPTPPWKRERVLMLAANTCGVDPYVHSLIMNKFGLVNEAPM